MNTKKKTTSKVRNRFLVTSSGMRSLEKVKKKKKMDRTSNHSTGSFKEENQWWEDFWNFWNVVKKHVEVIRDRKLHVETGKRLWRQKNLKGEQIGSSTHHWWRRINAQCAELKTVAFLECWDERMYVEPDVPLKGHSSQGPVPGEGGSGTSRVPLEKLLCWGKWCWLHATNHISLIFETKSGNPAQEIQRMKH